MAGSLKSLHVTNFRCLQDVTLEPGSLNVLFGPNGAGKSSLLDALWFVRDCAARGTDLASSDRHHGIGALWDGAEPGAHIQISIEIDSARYDVLFGFSEGRIEPFVGEKLYSKLRHLILIDRKIGSANAEFYHTNVDRLVPIKLRTPEKLALTNYLYFKEDSPEAADVETLLQFTHMYSSRGADFYALRKLGSEASHQAFLWPHWQNLWTVLRNLHDKQSADPRYDTIMDFMRRTFPDSFKDLIFDQLGPDRVYAGVLEKARREPIHASGLSDAHLQMLGLLTALFSEGDWHFSLVLFDEPETSLHPHAIATFAEAAQLAAQKWNRQIFLSTHSPVLVSQFEPDNIFSVEMDAQRRTIPRKLTSIPEIRDLLDHYAVGALYMAGEVARQSSTNEFAPAGPP